MGSRALAYVAAMTHVRRVPLVAAWLAIATTGLVVVAGLPYAGTAALIGSRATVAAELRTRK